MALNCTRLADQRIAPHRFHEKKFWGMGVYDFDGLVEPKSLLYRSYARGKRFCLGVATAPEGEAELVLDRAIYGGVLINHFGHFLTESLSRLWYGALEPEVPILLTLPRRFSAPRLELWQREIFELLGVQDRVIPLTRQARVQDCLVPDPGYEIQFTFAEEHARFLGRVPWRPEAGRKIWLSRAGPGGPNQPQQAAIDSALRRAGWEVVHPEQLSLGEQLDHYARAERIAGEEGSALHAVLLLSGCTGMRMDTLVRDPRQSAMQMNGNQATICAGKGFDLRVHWVPGEQVMQRDGRLVDKVYARPEAYVTILG